MFVLWVVLAGPGETCGATSGPEFSRSIAVLLREILHSGPWTARGRVHSVPVLPPG